MNKQQFSQVLSDLAEKEIPSQGDPWKEIAVRMDKNQKVSTELSRTGLVPKRRLSYGIITVLIMIPLLLGLIFTPVGQAFAARMMQFFIPADGGNLPGITSATAAPIVLVDVDFRNQLAATNSVDINGFCNEQMNPHCTLADAQKQVQFPLQKFTVLPEDMYFRGASVNGLRVTALYQCSSGCEVWLEQQKLNGATPEPYQVGSDTVIEQVQIGKDIGEYVRGTYTGENGVWDSDADVYFLRWQQGDILYTLSAVIDPTGEIPAFQPSRSAFIALAEGLSPDLSVADPLNPSYLTNVDDVQNLSGIRVVEPIWIPAGYLFSFATYDESTQFVCLTYSYNGNWYPSLFIRESVTAPLSQLKADLSSKLSSQTVKIGDSDIEALYSTGFAVPTGACGGKEVLFRAGESLQWRTRGRSFEIYSELPSPAGGAGLSQADMLNLAAGLIGNAVLPSAGLDANHLDSIAAAEQYLGYSIKTPTKLPAGSTFQYARVLDGSVRSLYAGSVGNIPGLLLYQCSSATQTSPCQKLEDEIPAEYKEEVAIKGEAAIFAAGAPGKTPVEDVETWHVHDPAVTESLYWQSSGWNYVLVSTGTEVERSILITIAESLK